MSLSEQNETEIPESRIPSYEKSVKVAVRMLESKMGLPWEIAAATNLSLQEILELKQRMRGIGESESS